ncbi:MAG: hypothetical protein KAH57_10730, partial [Thermoplasmata archaeon]|nr:hypothetical protein [Thermoplasmata archaeon]
YVDIVYNEAANVSLSSPLGELTGNITIPYKIYDAESDICSVDVEYSTDNKIFYPATQGVGGDRTTSLLSSSYGVSYTYVWDSKADIGGEDHQTVYCRIVPDDGKEGFENITASFQVDNNEVPTLKMSDISGEYSGNIDINYLLKDVESDLIDVDVEYSTNGMDFSMARQGIGSDGKNLLKSSPSGDVTKFVWSSSYDLDGEDASQVSVRIRPRDNDAGIWYGSSPFQVDNNDIPLVSITSPTGEYEGLISIRCTLLDNESDTLDVDIEYSADGSNYNACAMGPGGDGIMGLSSSPTGNMKTFEWDSNIDLFGVEHSTVSVRIRPKDNDVGNWVETSEFQIHNNHVPTLLLGGLEGELTGYISVEYNLFDTESDPLDIAVEYSIDGIIYHTCTSTTEGEGVTGLSSEPEGSGHNFIWDSVIDLEGEDVDTVTLRIKPMDNDEGIWYTSSKFQVDNNEIPTMTITPPFLDQEGEIEIGYNLLDSEKDRLEIVVEYSVDGIDYHTCSLVPGGEEITDLKSGITGFEHTYMWDSEKDLPGEDVDTVTIRIKPMDNDEGIWYESAEFRIDNNEVPALTISAVQSVGAGDISIKFSLLDAESDPLDISVEYCTDSTNFNICTIALDQEGITELNSSPVGVEHTFVWDSEEDLPGLDVNIVTVRIRPQDNDVGIWYISSEFHLDNNQIPSVVINTPSGDLKDDLDIEYSLLDDEGDLTSVIVEYSEDGTEYHICTMGEGGDTLTSLTSSEPGTFHTFVWDTVSDLGEVNSPTVYVRITVSDIDQGHSIVSEPFSVNNEKEIVDEEEKDTKEEASNSGILIGIIVVVIIVIAAAFALVYFKVIKKEEVASEEDEETPDKTSEEDAADQDDSIS